MRLPLAALVLALGLGQGAVARAQQPSSSGVKMAQDLVEEGRGLGKNGQWAEALDRFQRAETLSHRNTPQLAFYVGYAESRIGKLVEAGVDLRRAIELAHDSGNEPVAKAAQAELPELEARTPALTITVTPGAAPVSLQIDGGPLAVAALGSPVPLDPGDHTIVVQFAAGPVKKQVALVERQRATVTVEPLEGPKVAPAPPPVDSSIAPPIAPPATPVAEPAGSSPRKTLGLILTGVGVAGLAASGVFYGLARSSLSKVTSVCPSSPCVAPAGSPLPSDYQDARSQQTISIVLLSAGGAVAVAGLVLFVTGGSSAPSTSSAMLAPWIAPGGGGASLGGSFR